MLNSVLARLGIEAARFMIVVLFEFSTPLTMATVVGFLILLIRPLPLQ